MFRSGRSTSGFAFVGVVLTIFIMGLLAAILVPRMSFSSMTPAEKACRANTAVINSNIEYGIKARGLDRPSSLDDLDSTPWKELFPEQVDSKCPAGRYYEIDPSTGLVRLHDHGGTR